MMSARILVADDDPKILAFLRRTLTHHGYAVDTAVNGLETIRRVQEGAPDLVVLDIMMPYLDGIEVCRRIRAGEAGDGHVAAVPILMLTARDDVSDKVTALDSGADDYLAKPFDVEELLARIRALLRRRAYHLELEQQQRAAAPEVLRFGDLVMDSGTREVWRGNRQIHLTVTEWELLALFLRHPRQVLTREVILDQVWKYDFGGQSNLVEVFIGFLRRKLEAGGEPRLIHTVRGVGYVLK
jgi:two-component system response regulator MprA